VRYRASAISGSKPPFLARQFLIDFHSVAVANKKFPMSSFAAGVLAFEEPTVLCPQHELPQLIDERPRDDMEASPRTARYLLQT
jgi:hypothetical protein